MDTLDLAKIQAETATPDTVPLVAGTLTRTHMYRGRDYGPESKMVPEDVLLKERYDDATDLARANARAAGEPAPVLPSFKTVRETLAKQRGDAAAIATAITPQDGQPKGKQDAPEYDTEAEAEKMYETMKAGMLPNDGEDVAYADLPEMDKMRVRAMAAVHAGRDATGYHDAIRRMSAAEPTGGTISGVNAPETPAPAAAVPAHSGAPETNPALPPGEGADNPEPASDAIPEDFPYAAKLAAQGVLTFSRLSEITGEDELAGIGDTRWAEITGHPLYRKG